MKLIDIYGASVVSRGKAGDIAVLGIKLGARHNRRCLRLIVTKGNLSPIPAPVRPPNLMLAMPRDARRSTNVVGVRAAISAIFSGRHISKISDSVIGGVGIFVINLALRPFTSDDGPNDAMSEKPDFEYRTNPISSRQARRERLPASVAGVPALADVNPLSPVQTARRGIISEGFAAHLRCDIKSVSHVVSPYVRGQGRALLTQRFRPDFLSRIAFRPQAQDAMK